MHTVIFDLDGTLTDSAEGIARCLNYALHALGQSERPWKELLRYVGPDLPSTFSELLGTKDTQFLERAVALYRERYFPIGYRENRLYDGIPEVLSRLRADGSVLCIATNKYTATALKVLQHFNIDGLFAHVHGGEDARSKADILRNTVSATGPTRRPMVMIGDRDTDFHAAAEVGMPSIGVRWGYGNEEELALATVVVDLPSELPEAIRQNAMPMLPVLEN